MKILALALMAVFFLGCITSFRVDEFDDCPDQWHLLGDGVTWGHMENK